MLEAAKAAIDGGAQPVPARAGRARAARRRWPSTSSASTASTLDPDTEVLVTAGATEAIAAAVLALCEPGDEVVTFEPYYDSYAATIALAGGDPPHVGRCGSPTSRSTRRRCGRPSPRARGSSCSTRRTTRPARSSPAASSSSSPSWRVSTTRWASPTRSTSTSSSTAPSTSRWPRCPACSTARSRSARPARRSRPRAGRSAGLSGPAEAGRRCPRRSSSSSPTSRRGPFQPAVALALGLGDEVYAGAPRDSLQAKRDLLCSALEACGLAGVPARRDLLRHRRRRAARRRRRARRSPPPAGRWPGSSGSRSSVFHDDAEAARTLVRFAFCKQDDVLHEAARRLAAAST